MNAAASIRRIDGLLRGTVTTIGWRELAVWTLVAGAVHGAVLGSHAGRVGQALVSASKLPLLLAVSTGLCLPSFTVLHLLSGLRDDLPQALRATLGAQTVFACALLSLSPLIAFVYLSGVGYAGATLVNGLAFALATAAARVAMIRAYRDLERRSPRHRTLRRIWTVLFVFVSIQAAWVLRPFLGDPSLPVQFLRAEAWSNAYVDATRSLLRALGWLA